MKTMYAIYRFYADTKKPKQLVKIVSTLKEAQEHCTREDTHKPGVWFDGYQDITKEG